MALLNGMYIFVESEDVTHNVTTVTHPVEDGIDLTDHVLAEAVEISITGKIVGTGASVKISTIVIWQKQGTIVSYIGRNVANNFQVTSFKTSHPNTVHGGCEFDMTLREVRIANSPYKQQKNTAAKKTTATKSVTKTGTQQVQAKSKATAIYHVVKRGETAWGIAQKYSSKGATLKEIMEVNEGVLKVKGDWRTLPVGAKILVAYR